MGNARFRPYDSTTPIKRRVFEGPWRNADERRTLRQPRRHVVIWRRVAPGVHVSTPRITG